MSSVSTAGGNNSYYYTMQKKMFDKLDADGDGTLSQSEVQTGKQSTVTTDQATKIYNNMDADKSGGVTLDEFVSGTTTGAGVGLINQLPTNAIDVLLKLQQATASAQTTDASGEESAGGNGGGAASGGQTYDPLDTNKDGVVSEAEFEAGHPEAASTATSAGAAQGAADSGATDQDGSYSDSEMSQEQLQALAMLTTPPRLMGPNFFGSSLLGDDSSQTASMASLFGGASGTSGNAMNLFQLLENEQDSGGTSILM